MRLIIVRQVFSDRPVEAAFYQSFLEELIPFFRDHFRIKVAEQVDDLKIHLRPSDVANVAFLSQAMIGKARELGEKYPSVIIVVFSSTADVQARKVTDNVFLVRKNGCQNLHEAMKIFDSR